MMNTTNTFTENNYFEKVVNPIQTTPIGLVELVAPITKSELTNIYYKVDEQLSKQKKGKKRLKKIGKVEIPSEAFMVLLKKD